MSWGKKAIAAEAPLWSTFTITHVLDCIADPEKNRVIATLSDDISPVFPYVNAELRGVLYNPEAKTLTIRRGTRLLSFYERPAIFAKVDGKEAGPYQSRSVRPEVKPT